MLSMAQEDVKYLEFLLKQKQIHWRVIFTLYYDVLRLLCEALARSDGIKVSNHQGCFAYICMKHQDLELDWNFLERVRDVRNKAKYEGRIVTGKNWREIEIQMKLYVSTLEKEVEEKISE